MINRRRLPRCAGPRAIPLAGVACGTAVWLAALLAPGLARLASADPTKFILDTSHSSMKVTGTVANPILGGTVPLAPQQSGSDTASYTGYVWANLSAGGIQFPGSSSVAANNYVGPALKPDSIADYGVKATFFIFTTANATVVNLVFDLSSDQITVAPNGTFPANGTTATVTSGTIDYTAPNPVGNGSDSLAGSTGDNQATTSAMLAIVGQTQTLTIPVAATIPFTVVNTNDSSATFTGQLVATRTLVTPPIAYWQGNLDGAWSTIQPTAATNWRADSAGTTETLGLPGATTDVFFVTSNAASNLTTTLGADFSIKGLTFTADATAPVAIGGTNRLTLGADGLTMQSGAAATTINCPVTLGTSQTWSTASSNPLTVNGNLTLGATTLTKSGTGTVVLAGAQSFGNGSAIAVTGGTLRFSATANATSIGTGVGLSVATGAQLELANSGAALSDGTHFADVINNSQLPAGGLLVSGTNQRAGRITGTGAAAVSAGGSLSANVIQQTSLSIGGTAGSHALVTIAASSAAGNPLFDVSAFPEGADVGVPPLGGADRLKAELQLCDSTGLDGGGSLAFLSASAFGGASSVAAPSIVPEPSSLLLAALAAACCIGIRARL